MSLFSSRHLKTHPVAIFIAVIASLGVFGAGLKYLEESAQTQKALKPKDRSSLARYNPFLAPPSPTPSPQLSKEYIYAGSRLLAVEDANASAVPPADLAVWRPSEGKWYVFGGPGSATTMQTWGVDGDIPVPGDYDGDGKTDFAVYREDDPSSGYGKWYFIYSSNSNLASVAYGLTGDLPAQADYDGDGKTDRALFRPSNQTWYFAYSATDGTSSIAHGSSGDVPAPADYDGDGMADIAVWRASNTNFYPKLSSDSSTPTIDFSASGVPVSSDYDGDGKADYALFDAAASPYTKWYIRSSSSGSMLSTVTFGLPNDKPVQNDYDGDGLCDIAIWRPSSGTWYIINSHDASWRIQAWGLTGDIPVPAYFRR